VGIQISNLTTETALPVIH